MSETDKKIAAVVCDLDGVLIDTEFYQAGVIGDFFKSHGVTLPKEAFDRLIGSSGVGHWKVAMSYSSVKWDYDTYMKLYREFCERRPVDYKFLWNPSATKFLTYLNEHGYRVALASSSVAQKIERVLKLCGVADKFEVVISGEMFKESKPNPEIYTTVARELGLAPSRCVAIEDSPYGIRSATDAGLNVIAKRETRFAIDQSAAKWMVDDLMDVVPILDELNK